MTTDGYESYKNKQYKDFCKFCVSSVNCLSGLYCGELGIPIEYTSPEKKCKILSEWLKIAL